MVVTRAKRQVVNIAQKKAKQAKEVSTTKLLNQPNQKIPSFIEIQQGVYSFYLSSQLFKLLDLSLLLQSLHFSTKEVIKSHQTDIKPIGGLGGDGSCRLSLWKSLESFHIKADLYSHD